MQRKSDLCTPRKEIARLSSNIHIHVSVSDLYISTIGPPIYLQQNRQTKPGNIKIAYRIMNEGTESEAAQFWEYVFRIFDLLSLQCDNL
jgi:hypothetical protein